MVRQVFVYILRIARRVIEGVHQHSKKPALPKQRYIMATTEHRTPKLARYPVRRIYCLVLERVDTLPTVVVQALPTLRSADFMKCSVEETPTSRERRAAVAYRLTEGINLRKDRVYLQLFYEVSPPFVYCFYCDVKHLTHQRLPHAPKEAIPKQRSRSG